MSLPKTAADVLNNHIELEVESLDRIYLNVFQWRLQAENGIAWFFRHHRGEAFATAKVMAEMTQPFVKAIEDFAKTSVVPLIGFPKGKRKDELAKEFPEGFADSEGILFIGKAQEKALNSNHSTTVFSAVPIQRDYSRSVTDSAPRRSTDCSANG